VRKFENKPKTAYCMHNNKRVMLGSVAHQAMVAAQDVSRDIAYTLGNMKVTTDGVATTEIRQAARYRSLVAPSRE